MKQTLASNYAVIDLHLHLDGSLSLESVKELANLQNIAIPSDDTELTRRLQVSDDCRDLNEYLEKFSFPLTLLQTKEGIETAVYNLEQELKNQGLLYAEIRFAPQLHMQKGLTQTEVVEAAIKGLHRSDFHANLILCCMRGDQNHEENLENIRVAKHFLGKGVCAVDLAGAEALYPTCNFKDLFELASNLQVPYTIHAGEADGPQSVYTALDFGAKRIGHGVRSIEDMNLMKHLAQYEIPLELCPTSNLNTNIFAQLSDYPLRQLMDAGIKATINTDNTTVSGTSLSKEFQNLIHTFNLTEDELLVLVQNAVFASFADNATKAWLNQEIEKRFEN